MNEPFTRVTSPELPTIILRIPPGNTEVKGNIEVKIPLSISGVLCPPHVSSYPIIEDIVGPRERKYFAVSVSGKRVVVKSSSQWRHGFEIKCARPGAALAGQRLTRGSRTPTINHKPILTVKAQCSMTLLYLKPCTTVTSYTVSELASAPCKRIPTII